MQRERKEQEWLVTWFRLKYPDILIVASANGGKRNPREAANMKREGVLAGFPDLAIYKSNLYHHGLFIEMKAPQIPGKCAGVVSPLQRKILAQLNASDYLALTCWGWLEARKTIEDYFDDLF